MSFTYSFHTATICFLLVGLSLFGVRSLHIFAAQNGLFKYFLGALDSNKTPNGHPLRVLTTNGFAPKVDWQLRAPAVFVLAFTEDLSHPDTTLAGFLFLGAWAPAWVLIVLESLRKCNQGTVAAHILIPGMIIFNHSHSVGTPFYLAIHLLVATSVTATARDDLSIAPEHSEAIPFSFVFGYIIPIILISLPAPGVVSVTFKHTISGWYQQWNIFVAIFHYIYSYILAGTSQSDSQTDPYALKSLRIVYLWAFMMAQLPYWTVCVISFSAWFCGGIFNEKIVKSLQPQNLLVPTLPFTKRQARDMAEGFLWLIQWDYILGTLGTLIWSLVLYSRARCVYEVDDTWSCMLLRFLLYTVVGGPAALPVMIMWERDELVLGQRA